MKKTASALTLVLALLFSTMIGAQHVSRAVAQWSDWPSPPLNPDNHPPSISVLLPMQNQIYNFSEVPLNFTVTRPKTWHWEGMTMLGPGAVCWGTITFVKYNLDGVETGNISANDPTIRQTAVYYTGYDEKLSYSFSLLGLSDDIHHLIVSAVGESVSQQGLNTVIGNSTRIDFIVNTAPPRITVMSPENKAYNTTDVPLSFTTNEPVSLMSYSLDGKTNSTIYGNTTLPTLSFGSHNLTVYVNDMAGTLGASETVHFSITEPFPTMLVTASIVSLVIVGAGLLVYFKKRNPKRLK